MFFFFPDNYLPFYYIGIRQINGTFAYESDSTPISYTNWDLTSNEPNMTNDCVVVVHDGKWKTANCSTAQHITICQKKALNISALDEVFKF